MNKQSKIYVAGHLGMVGSAVMRALSAQGYMHTLTRTSRELDLKNQASVEAFFEKERPEVVVVAAAKVGGIVANNTYPAEFIYENLAIELNLIHSAFRFGTSRLLFLGSTCIYPKFAPQPIKEDSLLTSPLEGTNEAYAIAKIAGVKLCEYYRKQYGVCYHSAMPTNLYGQGDNYHPSHSHVIPGMLRRFHDAAQTGQEAVTIWGTGTPRREFLYADDLAEAVLHLLTLETPPNLVNIGFGDDVSILELAHLIAQTVGFKGEVRRDLTKPDGTPRKLTDISLIRSTGWHPKTSLKDGLAATYEHFLRELSDGTLRQV